MKLTKLFGACALMMSVGLSADSKGFFNNTSMKMNIRTETISGEEIAYEVDPLSIKNISYSPAKITDVFTVELLKPDESIFKSFTLNLSEEPPSDEKTEFGRSTSVIFTEKISKYRKPKTIKVSFTGGGSESDSDGDSE